MDSIAHIVIRLEELNTEGMFSNTSPDPIGSVEEERAAWEEREVMGEEERDCKGPHDEYIDEHQGLAAEY